jgi:hypothetical protein
MGLSWLRSIWDEIISEARLYATYCVSKACTYVLIFNVLVVGLAGRHLVPPFCPSGGGAHNLAALRD